jgi:hypothetical protein
MYFTKPFQVLHNNIQCNILMHSIFPHLLQNPWSKSHDLTLEARWIKAHPQTIFQKYALLSHLHASLPSHSFPSGSFYMNFYILPNNLLCATCPVHLTLDSYYFQHPITSCPFVQTHERTWNNPHKILVYWKNTFLNTAWNCSCCQMDTWKSSMSHPCRHFVN